MLLNPQAGNTNKSFSEFINEMNDHPKLPFNLSTFIQNDPKCAGISRLKPGVNGHGIAYTMYIGYVFVFVGITSCLPI